MENVTRASLTDRNQFEVDHRNTVEGRLQTTSEMAASKVNNNLNNASGTSENKENESKKNMKQVNSKMETNVNLNIQNNNGEVSTIQDPEIDSNSSTLHNSFSKSNPQLNAMSFVEVHPLSTSFMNSNSRNLNLTSSVQISPNELNVRMRPANSRFNSLQGSEILSDNQLANLRRLSHQTIPVQIPIIGYEVMEERARFTIYKLRIDDPRTGLSWMVFRRYTDFVRLYQKLKIEYRNLTLPLPEKRLFRNNFDPVFLDERARGLQVFVNAVVKRLSSDRSVREFFCLDEPPPVGDSEPEAQALFGALEDTVGALKNQIRQQDDALKYMRQKVFYLEEKMKVCGVCNPLGDKPVSSEGHESPTSSNGS